jgi:N-acetylglucosamine kinase-like BadF-type ATPase
MSPAYYLGVDGGITKTMAILGDEKGRLLGMGTGGASNYKVVGLDRAMANLTEAIQGALAKADLSLKQIKYAVFGLSGMDLLLHREVLNTALGTTFSGLSFDLVNDTWIMLKAGSSEGWGMALVCGGGANACACDRAQTWVTLRGLGYQSGLRGGGLVMARDILHYAFLSHDGTGPKFVLEQKLLDLLKVSDYDTLQLLLLEFGQDTEEYKEMLHQILELLPLVFDGATKGDEACKRILLLQAESLAEGITGLIHKMNFEQETFTLVFGGGIFKGRNPILVDRLAFLIHEVAPLAKLSIPLLDPVMGAYIMAIQKEKSFAPEVLYSVILEQVLKYKDRRKPKEV